VACGRWMGRSAMRSTEGAGASAPASTWLVFPLHTPHDGSCSCGRRGCANIGKHPRTPNGLKDATTDPELISRWRGMWPDANRGVRTGAESGIVVLDVDPRHGGDDSLHELEREHGEVPATIECLTGGGGRHIYFQAPRVFRPQQRRQARRRPGRSRRRWLCARAAEPPCERTRLLLGGR
jgi:bifunctional DNA primase/polymerase-like protein